MSDLHELCAFGVRPITKAYLEQINFYLQNGVPATYTVEEAYCFSHDIADEPTTTTTPLHLICQNVPADCSDDEKAVVEEMVRVLFEHGAGWSFTDANNNTPGCILIARGLSAWSIYKEIVDAGVRAELLLRKVSNNIEFVSDAESVDFVPDLVVGDKPSVSGEEQRQPDLHDESSVLQDDPSVSQNEPSDAASVSGAAEQRSSPRTSDVREPADDQQTFLKTKLEYKNDALVTKDSKDGVMMSWESDIMRLGCETLFTGTAEDDSELVVLNIGFGMGIIDSMINAKNPTKHYICEAHPDVLARMKETGWYNKSNVVVLEGRWQQKLDELLSQGVFFNGIYYDTFSEHYSDMLDLYDLIVGLLKPHGVFSFFNGLGADRQVIYEVYKKLVEIDLNNYGLAVSFNEMEVPSLTKAGQNVWDDINRPYWKCPVYYHPEVRFMDG